jgi:hypothetical protein
LYEEPCITVLIATQRDFGTFLFTGFNIAHDPFLLSLGNLRALEDALFEWVPNSKGFDMIGKCLCEFIVNTGLNE